MIHREVCARLFFNISTLIIVTVFAASCTTRPVIQNVTRYNSYQIAQKNRCEIREAIANRVFDLLAFYGHNDVAERLKSGELSFYDFFNSEVNNLSVFAKRIAQRYELAFIAYEYEFDITEENKISAGVDFLDIITRGQLTLGIDGNNDRKRQNKRNFKAIDNFGEMLSNVDFTEQCNEEFQSDPGRNLIYPISGSLGLSEIVDTFLALNQSGNLVGNVKGAEKVPTLADTMTFTTTFSATVNPVIKLSAVGSKFSLTGADLKKTSSRVDVHKLVIALTLPEDGYKLTGRTVAQKREQLRRSAIVELDRQREIDLIADTVFIRQTIIGQADN